MKSYHVFDPLYGKVSLPAFLSPFLEAPEFRRLGFIRLLNFESFELAALSEVRRLSHTMGVLHLSSRLTLLDFGPEEVRAFLFAVVLHDIGTPPFGHTLEYEFIRRYGLDHEAIAARVLDATHHRLSLDHQVYRGLTVRLSKAIEGTGHEQTIRDILARKHPLSSMLFSDIDVDNIDNVYRMAHYLGYPIDRRAPVILSSKIDIDRDGKKYLARENEALVADWLHWRCKTYTAILDTVGHRRNQAIFSRIVHEALEHDLIDQNDWFLTDEALLIRLSRESVLHPYFGDLYSGRQLREFSFSVVAMSQIARSDIIGHRNALTHAMENRLGGSVYVLLVSLGASLSRKVTFTERNTGDIWSLGQAEPTYRLHIYPRSSKLRHRSPSLVDQIVKAGIAEYACNQGWRIGRS
jgi:HD superfamily phosphohydrolase